MTNAEYDKIISNTLSEDTQNDLKEKLDKIREVIVDEEEKPTTADISCSQQKEPAVNVLDVAKQWCIEHPVIVGVGIFLVETFLCGRFLSRVVARGVYRGEMKVLKNVYHLV